MDVIIIHEENHGIIGVAYDYESAVGYLVNQRWLPAEILDKREEWHPIDELLGDDWLDKLLSWDIDNFNTFFEGSFYLQIEAVFDIH